MTVTESEYIKCDVDVAAERLDERSKSGGFYSRGRYVHVIT